MRETGPAARLELWSWSAPSMRAFHMSWIAFFSCFFAWFALAPLMGVVRADLGLSDREVADSMIAAVAITALARLAIGPLCHRLGARRTYACLLLLGTLPVLGAGLAESYESFLLIRLATGVLGASFVVTQYHTSTQFAPSCVGMANATAAGWGNLGGGAAQVAMPAVLGGLLLMGADPSRAWRLAMVAPGLLLAVTAVAYLRLTRDDERDGPAEPGRGREARRRGTLGPALRDYRVWVLTLAYAACFGVELTLHGVGALYFHDRFGLDLAAAGLVAGLFGAMNLFARALGGWSSDRVAAAHGLHARTVVLAATLLLEGLGLVVFSRMTALPGAVAALVAFSVCVQMAEGATFALVPFVRRRALGAVAGVVGAGGNAGAITAGLIWGRSGLAPADAFLALGAIVVGVALVVAVVLPTARFRTSGGEGRAAVGCGRPPDGLAGHQARRRTRRPSFE